MDNALKRVAAAAILLFVVSALSVQNATAQTQSLAVSPNSLKLSKSTKDVGAVTIRYSVAGAYSRVCISVMGYDTLTHMQHWFIYTDRFDGEIALRFQYRTSFTPSSNWQDVHYVVMSWTWKVGLFGFEPSTQQWKKLAASSFAVQFTP